MKNIDYDYIVRLYRYCRDLGKKMVIKIITNETYSRYWSNECTDASNHQVQLRLETKLKELKHHKSRVQYSRLKHKSR